MGKTGLTSAVPLRGEVYLTNFDPVRGHEIAKTRPAVIIQNDIGNRESPVVIVAAITSNKAGHTLFPISVLVHSPEGGLEKDSVVNLNQIRSIDKERLGKCLGKLSNETMSRVNKALAISIGLK